MKTDHDHKYAEKPRCFRKVSSTEESRKSSLFAVEVIIHRHTSHALVPPSPPFLSFFVVQLVWVDSNNSNDKDASTVRGPVAGVALPPDPVQPEPVPVSRIPGRRPLFIWGGGKKR